MFNKTCLGYCSRTFISGICSLRTFKRLSHTHNGTKPLIVYTDGSYIESIKRGGMGIYFPNNDFTSLSIPYVNTIPPTNQRCELLAIKYALLIRAHWFPTKPLHIYTDSKYAIECLTIYNHIWSRNGWIKTNGKSVKNQDLLKPMVVHLSDVQNVQFNHVKAHTSNLDIHSLNNNIADAYARRGNYVSPPFGLTPFQPTVGWHMDPLPFIILREEL